VAENFLPTPKWAAKSDRENIAEIFTGEILFNKDAATRRVAHASNPVHPVCRRSETGQHDDFVVSVFGFEEDLDILKSLALAQLLCHDGVGEGGCLVTLSDPFPWRAKKMPVFLVSHQDFHRQKQNNARFFEQVESHQENPEISIFLQPEQCLGKSLMAGQNFDDSQRGLCISFRQTSLIECGTRNPRY
jgi:hypothetical protein